MAVSSEAWLPILTFVLGGVFTTIGEGIREYWRWKRQCEERDYNEKASVSEKRLERRRQVLLDLKGETERLRKLSLNSPEDSELEFAWSNNLFNAEINMLVLIGAIGDTELQSHVNGMLDASRELALAVASNASNYCMDAMDSSYTVTSMRLGQLLHEIDSA